MEQVRWEDSGAVEHLGEAVRLSCTPKQEMLKLATVVPQKGTHIEMGSGQLGKRKASQVSSNYMTGNLLKGGTLGYRPMWEHV